jgi:hypothetical protein
MPILQVTRDEDLELIFSRFGKIVDCEIVRDFVTGDRYGCCEGLLSRLPLPPCD